ncbi:uncharacterized protein HKW66_Vig0046260 [Vigna angularis]|uniref:Uncharacterized protein n=1 Tax=Phaseolus angularis TaxID=3914 RepID=A0A8T0L188_PHAAN|nr:uncharacterized protein HKW66_Vig0046260 [Vigna angularis]
MTTNEDGSKRCKEKAHCGRRWSSRFRESEGTNWGCAILGCSLLIAFLDEGRTRSGGLNEATCGTKKRLCVVARFALRQRQQGSSRWWSRQCGIVKALTVACGIDAFTVGESKLPKTTDSTLCESLANSLKTPIARSGSSRFLELGLRSDEGLDLEEEKARDCKVTKDCEDGEVEKRKLKMKKWRHEGEGGNDAVKKVKNTSSFDEGGKQSSIWLPKY